MISFFEVIKARIGLVLLDVAEWLSSRNHMKLYGWIMWFIIKYLVGRDPEHEHSWQITYVDDHPEIQCRTCGRKLQGDSPLEGIIKKKEKVIERLKEIAGGIPDDLDGESAKQKLFQVRDSLKGILEYLE